MTDRSLVIVGSGIKFLSHLTTETKAYIQAANKILYLINEPAMQEWLNRNHSNAESLDKFYFQNRLRINAYQEITQYILENLNQYTILCVILYGHPTVFAKPALDAAIIAKEKGIYVEVLPGISAEACLFADLLIDPGTAGCVSLEATHMLIYQKQIDNSCHIIIWQIGVIGAKGHSFLHDNTLGINLLTEYLQKFYPPYHEVMLYKASQYAGIKAYVKKIKLEELSKIIFPSNSSLYIPPLTQQKIDTNTLRKLGLNHS